MILHEWEPVITVSRKYNSHSEAFWVVETDRFLSQMTIWIIPARYNKPIRHEWEPVITTRQEIEM